MKFLTFIFSLLLTSQAFAHADHALGDGALHMLYHAVFWILFAVVAVKLVSYFKNKKKQKDNL
jgi:tellurite resistance protein TehA-like permease